MEPIDNLVRAAMPRAPRGIADAVERRIAARRRTRRALAGVGALVACAAALVLWLVARPSPTARPSAWIATSGNGVTVDGTAVRIGRPLAVGALVHVGDGGAATLERPSAGERARVELAANTDARVGDGAIELLSGQARLEGPEARLTGEVAEVTTLGASAAATVELRRNPMMTKKTAMLAALMTVGVVDGGARVVAKGHEPLVLAKNDRTMIAPKLPPLTTRAAAKKAAPVPATKPKAPDAPPPPATADGDLDKGAFRAAVRTVLGDIKSCYEAALVDNPDLEGRFVVQMTVVNKDGKGKITDGEVQPSDGDMNAPAMQQCVLQALSRADFPPSLDGEPVIVSYPFVFQAR